MKTNMIFADRVLRMFLAVATIALYFIGVIPAGIGLWLMIGAVIFLITSFTGYCPIYAVFGIGNKRKAV